MLPLNERENKIIKLASELLRNKERNEGTIDTKFIFNFEPLCFNAIRNIRHRINSLHGKDSDLPFSMSSEDGWRLYNHIQDHLDLRIEYKGEAYGFISSHNGYRPIDATLVDIQLQASVRGDDQAKERIEQHILNEAEHTIGIVSGLRKLAHRFGILPADHDLDNYSKKEIKAIWDRILTWVVFDKGVPTFCWQNYVLVESRTPRGQERMLHTQGVPKSYKKEGIRPEIRIRTWAIYFLSKRGGGRRNASSSFLGFPKGDATAMGIWNSRFREFEQGSLVIDSPSNYRHHLNSILITPLQK